MISANGTVAGPSQTPQPDPDVTAGRASDRTFFTQSMSLPYFNEGTFHSPKYRMDFSVSQPWERPSFYTSEPKRSKHFHTHEFVRLATSMASLRYFIVFEAETDRAVVFSWSDVGFASSFHVTNFWVVLNDFFLDDLSRKFTKPQHNLFIFLNI